MIGLDTSAIIDMFKGDKGMEKFLDSNIHLLASTMLNYLELQCGINKENKAHVLEAKYYEDIFNSFYLLNLDPLSCRKSAEIQWNLKKQGKVIGKFDSTIAAIFLKNGISKILTKNAKHYERIEGIQVITY